MTVSATLRTGFALLLFLTLGGIAGCGGGGGGEPQPGPNITVAEGGTVTSADGVVQLIVPPNSASTAVTASIDKAEPDADAAADPSYIAGTTYQYNGPEVSFSVPANWEVASPAAVMAAPLAPSASGREHALDASNSSIDPERMCNREYANGYGQDPVAVWVTGTSCPPGCKSVSQPLFPGPSGKTLCVPEVVTLAVVKPTPCPSGFVDITAQFNFPDLPAFQMLRMCRTKPVNVAAALVGGIAGIGSLADLLGSCVVQNGKFICKTAFVKPAVKVKIVWDKTPPTTDVDVVPDPAIAFNPIPAPFGIYTVSVPAGGAVTMNLTVSALGLAEPVGLRKVELYEFEGVAMPLDGQSLAVASKLVGTWPASGSFVPGIKSSKSDAFPVVFDSTDSPLRWFFSRAYDWAGNAQNSTIHQFKRVAAVGPTIDGFSALPAVIQAPGGNTTLTWATSNATSVSIDQGVGNVTPVSAGAQAVNVGASTVFTLTATAANGLVSTQTASVTVAPDSTAPTVTLAASPSAVLLPGSTTLQAVATDAIGVTKVEFYRGNTLINTDTTAPYQHSVTFSAADIGNVSFTARAFDAEGNNATSAAAIVTVSTPSSGDTYVGPNGVDAGNTTCAQATPCKSIAKAAGLAQASATVWLQDGTYTQATQPALISIPAGLALRALTPGMAVLQRGLVLAGSATVVGVVLDRGPGNNFTTSISASSGTVTLEGIKFTGLLTSSSPPISASGTAQVTLSPGNVADYTDALLGQSQAANIFALLTGDAQLTINGGSLGGTGLGGGSPVTFAQGFAAFQLQGNARLSINNASVKVNTNGIFMNGAATQVTLTNTTLTAVAMQGTGRGINAAAGTPTISLAGSTISGFVYASLSAPLSVGPGGAFNGLPGVNATVSLTDSVLSGGSVGLYVTDGTSVTLATVMGHNAQIKNNYFGGVYCLAACDVDLTGGEVSANGTTNANLASGFSFSGGLWFGATDKAYTVKLRNVAVINNNSLSTANTNTNDNSGITLAGTAGSSYDLGTLASPGGNTFTGNTTGANTSGVNTKVAAGVTVTAVGNTFTAGVQGASAQGKYLLGTSPCGVSTCNLSTGTGANYRVTSGVLKLAQ